MSVPHLSVVITAVMPMPSDLKLITERIDHLFKRKMQTRYWLMVTDDVYDKTYNFFFNFQKKGQRLRSVPLHTVSNYDLGYLERLITGLRKHTQLTIEYVGFTGQRWPVSQRIIQRKKEADE